MEAFGKAIALAAQAYTENPMGSPPIPNWNRVKAAIPDIFEMLETAVEADNR